MKVWTLSGCSSHPPSHICSATINSNVIISPDKRPLVSYCGHSVFTIRLEKKLSYLHNVVSLHDGLFWNFIFHDLKLPRKRNGDLPRSDWPRGLWEIVLTVGRCRRTQTIVGGIISWFVAPVYKGLLWAGYRAAYLKQGSICLSLLLTLGFPSPVLSRERMKVGQFHLIHFKPQEKTQRSPTSKQFSPKMTMNSKLQHQFMLSSLLACPKTIRLTAFLIMLGLWSLASLT